jgi:hypothetical protein
LAFDWKDAHGQADRAEGGHGNRLSSSRIARDHSQYRMHALEGTRIRAEICNQHGGARNEPLLFSYLSAFAAAITKTVTKGRPEQNRTTSMASFVIARPNLPYNPA